MSYYEKLNLGSFCHIDDLTPISSAALELAATLDHRITNRHVFRLGLRGLPGSNKARRIVLPDADVLRILKAAYDVDRAFGLLVEVLAVTGARLSQAARLTCADLQADRPDLSSAAPQIFNYPQVAGRLPHLMARVAMRVFAF
jgi:hypothetical protein